MKRAMTYALAAGLVLGTSSLAIAQQTSPNNTQPGMQSSPSQQSPGARSGGSMGQSGMSTAPRSSSQQMTESDVKAALESQGYTNVSDVKKSGDKYTAKAMKNGKQQQVTIDTKTGTMQPGG